MDTCNYLYLHQRRAFFVYQSMTSFPINTINFGKKCIPENSFSQ